MEKGKKAKAILKKLVEVLGKIVPKLWASYKSYSGHKALESNTEMKRANDRKERLVADCEWNFHRPDCQI